jgi:hypothetical protein
MNYVFSNNGQIVERNVAIASDDLVLKAHDWVCAAPKRSVTVRVMTATGPIWVMKITASGRVTNPKAYVA